MIKHFPKTFQAFILITFSAFLFKLNYTGDINKYINPKYVGLSILASLVFFILSFIQIIRIKSEAAKNDFEHIHDHSHSCNHDHSCQHDHGSTLFTKKKVISYAIIVFPLVTGYFLPAKYLDAKFAEMKGGTLMLSNQQSNLRSDNEADNNENSTTMLPTYDHEMDTKLANQKPISEENLESLQLKLRESKQIKMTDRVFTTYYDEINVDLDTYEGKTIEFEGFVYREEGFSSNQLVISRFLITHCIADSTVIGFLSEFPEAELMEEDTWLKAKGVISKTTYSDTELPLIKIIDWEIVNEPKQRYVYPILVD